MFATLYKLLSCLHLDWPSLLVLLPRVVVQAPLAAAADYHVFKLASLLYGSNVGWYAVSSSPHLSSSFSFPPPPPPSSFPIPHSVHLRNPPTWRFSFSSPSTFPPFLPSLFRHYIKPKNTSKKITSTTALTVFQLLCNLASWFTFYSITRTLSNSTEAALTPVVLYYWLLATQTAGKSNAEAQKYITLCTFVAFKWLGKCQWAKKSLLHMDTMMRELGWHHSLNPACISSQWKERYHHYTVVSYSC